MFSPSLLLIRDREFKDKAYLGTLYVIGLHNDIMFKSASLERACLQNQKSLSCIPVGNYSVVYEKSSKFGKYLWELKNVPARSEVKFHTANFWHQLEGCIALGAEFSHLDNDGIPDLVHSKKTMEIFENVLNPYTCDTLTLRIYQ